MTDCEHLYNALPQGYRLQEYELVRVLGRPSGRCSRASNGLYFLFGSALLHEYISLFFTATYIAKFSRKSSIILPQYLGSTGSNKPQDSEPLRNISYSKLAF